MGFGFDCFSCSCDMLRRRVGWSRVSRFLGYLIFVVVLFQSALGGKPVFFPCLAVVFEVVERLVPKKRQGFYDVVSFFDLKTEPC